MGLFENIWKGIRRMFGYTTLKTIVGKDVALSSRMIDAINDWKSRAKRLYMAWADG